MRSFFLKNMGVGSTEAANCLPYRDTLTMRFFLKYAYVRCKPDAPGNTLPLLDVAKVVVSIPWVVRSPLPSRACCTERQMSSCVVSFEPDEALNPTFVLTL